MADHRHHQAARGLRGQPQVHGGKAGELIGLVIKTGVDLRVVTQRQHHGAHQEWQQRQAPARGTVLGVQAHAQVFEFGHVNFFDIGEMRNAALGLLHFLRNLAAQADHRDHFFSRAQRVALLGCRVAVVCATVQRAGIQIRLHDAPGRAGPAGRAQVNAEFPGATPHGRGGNGLAAGVPFDRLRANGGGCRYQLRGGHRCGP